MTAVNRTGDQGAFSRDEISLADRFAVVCGIIIDTILAQGRSAAASEARLNQYLGSTSDAQGPDGDLKPPASVDGEKSIYDTRLEVADALDHLQDHDLELVRDLVNRLLRSDDTGLVF